MVACDLTVMRMVLVVTLLGYMATAGMHACTPPPSRPRREGDTQPDACMRAQGGMCYVPAPPLTVVRMVLMLLGDMALSMPAPPLTVVRMVLMLLGDMALSMSDWRMRLLNASEHLSPSPSPMLCCTSSKMAEWSSGVVVRDSLKFRLARTSHSFSTCRQQQAAGRQAGGDAGRKDGSSRQVGRQVGSSRQAVRQVGRTESCGRQEVGRQAGREQKRSERAQAHRC